MVSTPTSLPEQQNTPMTTRRREAKVRRGFVETDGVNCAVAVVGTVVGLNNFNYNLETVLAVGRERQAGRPAN